ncbi:MAG: HDOD domain-containing protein [Firmicutes bacterium]|jgi:c-di-GMP-related signal transduction protein|nr:HDOD domain-containing protein [Bacillota bacterium]
MNFYVARQPIFNSAGKVYAYELLFRDGIENVFRSKDPDLASLSVMSNAFISIGIDNLTGGKRAFINFTGALLERQAPLLAPRALLGIEIPNGIVPTESLVKACRELKRKGYILALDNFVPGSGQEALVELADIVKINFLDTSAAQRRQLRARLDLSSARFLASRVESVSQYDEARDADYSYFQGYYFAEPVVTEGTTVPAYSATALHLLSEVRKPEPEFETIADIVAHDPGLSYRVLRLVNSAAFRLQTEITSIKRALVMMGMNDIKEWFPPLIMTTLTRDKPDELVIMSVVRARFAEILARESDLVRRSGELFLTGLFSAIDAMLDRPMEDAIAELSLPLDVRKALLGEEGPFTPLYNLVLAYEQGRWDEVSELAKQAEVPEPVLPRAYAAAVSWAREFCEQGGASRA